MRNLSLIGKICVIKSLVLPQLIYLFSVLSITNTSFLSLFGVVVRIEFKENCCIVIIFNVALK